MFQRNLCLAQISLKTTSFSCLVTSYDAFSLLKKTHKYIKNGLFLTMLHEIWCFLSLFLGLCFSSEKVPQLCFRSSILLGSELRRSLQYLLPTLSSFSYVCSFFLHSKRALQLRGLFSLLHQSFIFA